jgi:hypothetical protein
MYVSCGIPVPLLIIALFLFVLSPKQGKNSVKLPDGKPIAMQKTFSPY